MPKEASREPAHTLQPGRRCQQVSAVTLSNRAPRQHLPSWQWTWARVGGGAEVGAGGSFVRVPRGSAGLQLTLRGGPGRQAAVCAWLCLGPAGCHPLPEAGSGQALPPLDSEVLSTPRFILLTSSLCVEEGNSSHFAERTRNINSFLVFLRYQCYYEYPLLTYLEYPILIAQGIRWDWGVRCFGQSRVLVVKLKKIPNAQSKYFHQRGQQVCSAPVPVEDQGLRHRERPHLEPRCIHLCNKNNNNDNDHRRSYDSHTFRDHACFKRVGNHHGPSLQEDGGKG
ncbi:solute carrier family 66 member 3 isoform X2 [Neofelis nebulosa]|uniref:solute carrier family 66 member 3 isoform X2 n=1 Tax=Neofelis nebulosa TaxID=61452 RepID=UPI00272BE0FD|nr:solute carrier family 66 member 3 isoform X2 [Neofelis nebulosa]